MRTKDENKTKAIKAAVIAISQEDGFTNLTTAKVAKRAGVSPATIYLNYKDKTDMLSRLYEEVKDDLHQGVAEAIASAGDDIEAQLRAALHFSVAQTLAHPREAHFVSALWTNQELLDEAARAYGQTTAGPLAKLFQRLNASPDFTDAPAVIVAAVASLPTTVLQTAIGPVAQATIEQTIGVAVKALKR